MMRTSMMVGLIAAVIVLAGPVSGVLGHEGHDHKVMGTVTMAAADHVMLNDTDKKPMTVFVTTDTRVLRDKKPMKAAEIPVGSRVVIVARMEKTRLIARTIDVGVVASSR